VSRAGNRNASPVERLGSCRFVANTRRVEGWRTLSTLDGARTSRPRRRRRESSAFQRRRGHLGAEFLSSNAATSVSEQKFCPPTLPRAFRSRISALQRCHERFGAEFLPSNAATSVSEQKFCPPTLPRAFRSRTSARAARTARLPARALAEKSGWMGLRFGTELGAVAGVLGEGLRQLGDPSARSPFRRVRLVDRLTFRPELLDCVCLVEDTSASGRASRPSSARPANSAPIRTDGSVGRAEARAICAHNRRTPPASLGNVRPAARFDDQHMPRERDQGPWQLVADKSLSGRIINAGLSPRQQGRFTRGRFVNQITQFHS
jgi:hypothetical protein